MNAVGFLQNAWSPLYAGGPWPRESWLKALHRSHSGRRLRVLVEAAGFEPWWDNTTPICGDTPNSKLTPDPDHIRSVLIQQDPEVVITFGTQARDAVKDFWQGRPLLVLPHPAWRFLKKETYVKAGELLRSPFSGTVTVT